MHTIISTSFQRRWQETCNHSPLNETIAVSLVKLFIMFICLCSGFPVICYSNCAVLFVLDCSSPQSSLTFSIIQTFSNLILSRRPSLVKTVFRYKTYLTVVRGLTILKESNNRLSESMTPNANWEF